MELKNFFVDTTYQKILVFLSSNPNRKFFELEVSKKSQISRGAANHALQELTSAGLVTSEKKGRMSFYSVDLKNPVIRQWKVLNNIFKIYNLVKKLRKISDKIILFGSAASGTNIKESDLDLFALTEVPQKANEVISKSKARIQLIAKKPLDFIELKTKDAIFYDEILRGITLWEKTS